MLSTQCLNELLVVGAVAVLSQDAQLGLAALNGTGGLVQAAGQAVMGKGSLQHTLLCWYVSECRKCAWHGRTEMAVLRSKGSLGAATSAMGAASL